MRILFTGGSSFTGLWYARELARRGHDLVVNFTRGAVSEYEGVRRLRVETLLKERVTPLFGARFGTDRFIDAVAGAQTIDVLCHHAAEVTSYKSLDFDVSKAVASNTMGLSRVLQVFADRGGVALVLTGTYFEPDEGKGSLPLRAFSPYGLSKGITWQLFRYYCHATGIRIGKFVMPNPIGEWEEPRLTAYLISTWLRGEKPVIALPEYVRDNVPARLLARCYADFVGSVAGDRVGERKASPSGWVESVGAFVERAAQELRPRTALPCEFELRKQTEFLEPLERQNLESALPLWSRDDNTRFWNDLLKYYKNGARLA
jgi:UDP-glucose 4-epimerase